jgi:hypothetical protein
LFSEPERSRIAERLVAEASENIPFHEKATPEEMDRVRFAILKRIKQSRKNERTAFEDAKCDWRDLYVSAGFASSATAHNAWYEIITSKKLPNEAVDATSPRGVTPPTRQDPRHGQARMTLDVRHQARFVPN